jgi:hypothetical protein
MAYCKNAVGLTAEMFLLERNPEKTVILSLEKIKQHLCPYRYTTTRRERTA